MSDERGFIVCVARNNVQLTKQAIKSALAQDMPCDVLLIDNASSDGTIAWAATRSVARVALREQQSLSACWNIGLYTAWRMTKHALVINNDIQLRPDAYRLLLAHGGPFVTCVSVDDPERMNYPEPPTTERPHPDFSCFLIRRSVTEVVGWFNEDYFPAYGEDADYHVRMHRAGVHAVCIDLPFLHYGASTLKSAEPGEQQRIRRGADANRARFKRKYGCAIGTSEYYGIFTSPKTAA